MLGARWLSFLVALPALVLAQTNAPVVNLAGTFNDWNPTNAAYAMKLVGDDAYEHVSFFRAGKYKFKFAVNGGFDKAFGAGAAGRLVQPGADIPLVIPKHGAYWFRLVLSEHEWEFAEVPLKVPHAIVTVESPVEVNLPIVLDASESVARPDLAIQQYKFAQDTNNAVRAALFHNGADIPQASVILPREGTYWFTCVVNDGTNSLPETITLKAETSYQFGNTSLRRVAPGNFECVFKTSAGVGVPPLGGIAAEPPEGGTPTATSQSVFSLVKNHDSQNALTNVVLSTTSTNPVFWRVRYDERAGLLRCSQENYVEFVYRPDDDLILKDRVKVHKVALAGSFNSWSATATPLALLDNGSYAAYLRLDDGLHHYKFVVNGDIWRPDPNADPDLREDDRHQGFNSGIFVGERAKSFGPQPTNDVNLAAVRQKVESLTSELAEVRLRTLRGDAQQVSVVLVSDREQPVAMQADEPRSGFEWWSATVPATQPLRYYFTLRDGKTTRRYGDEPFSVVVTNRVTVPDWARHVVWYQIFPERFRNGTPDNDPPKTLPWRWDWYKFAPGETPNDAKTFSGAWYSRQFGGDLQGVMEKLPYLRELGVTALYFCPVFENGSNHGYDTADYRHISRFFGVKEELPAGETLDPATWKWTASDKLFVELVRQAHAQGLKVVIDGVFNHMGRGSFALQDVLTNGMNSVYADWFDIEDWGPPVKYKSWDGGGAMPNFRKDPETGIASASARQYIYDVTRRWLEAGIDGWRLDVAPDVPAPFWVEWRKFVKSINPDALIVGEDWGMAESHLQGDQWDATMNYPFVTRATRFFIDKQRKISASEFDRQLRELLRGRPMPVNFVMQNLYDSHDTDRLVNMIVNPDRDYDGCNRPQDGCPYDGSKPGAEAYRVMKLMVTFQMTFLGAPMIWYGDEVGMFGADDPTDRKPMLWKDLMPYHNPQDFVMDDVWKHYARLIAIRNTYPALRTGLYRAVLTDDENEVFAFTRTDRNEVVTVVLNNSTKDVTTEVAVSLPDDAKLVDVLSGAVEIRDVPLPDLGITTRGIRLDPNGPAHVVRQGKVRLRLAGKSAAILVKP